MICRRILIIQATKWNRMIINLQTLWLGILTLKNWIMKLVGLEEFGISCTGLLKGWRCCFMQTEMEEADLHADNIQFHNFKRWSRIDEEIDPQPLKSRKWQCGAMSMNFYFLPSRRCLVLWSQKCACTALSRWIKHCFDEAEDCPKGTSARTYIADKGFNFSDLQEDLSSIQSNIARSQFCSQRLLCRTLAGNNVYILTITSPASEVSFLKKKIQPSLLFSITSM